METNPNTTSDHRQAAVNGLAIVGFVALVGAGIWLAVYSARFVPGAVSRLGSAAVALSQIFVPGSSSSLSVVPPPSGTGSTTIPFGDGSTSTPATSTTPVTTPVQTPPPVHTNPTPVAGTPTSGQYPINGATTTAPATGLYGLPDFTVTITAVGYLATSSADSFVASPTVPTGTRPAVRFTIKNVGTNATGSSWVFSAQIPTGNNYLYQSLPQQNLNPGDSIDYTLGFDQAIRGSNEPITITANSTRTVAESNMNDDSISAQVTVN
jgi:hypothetical protein